MSHERVENFNKNQHNIWDYIYYLQYLEEQNSADLDGIEFYVKDAWKKEYTHWQPIEETQYLVEDGFEEKITDKI